MTFNNSKCKVMTLNLRKPPVTFKLFGKNIDSVTEYKYLGVKLSNKRQTSLVTQQISSILEAGRRVNCIRHYGFSSDGLRPATSIKMYKILVRPILEYAGQVLSYRHYYYYSNGNDSRNKADLNEHIVKLEAFQNRVLKMLVPCSKSTSPAIVRIFSGCMPIDARIDILKLRYFWRITQANDNNLAFSILKYTREELHTRKIGFIHEVFKLCQKHNCLYVWLKIKRPKENPLETIRRTVEQNCLKKDQAVCLASTCIYSSSLYTGNAFKQKKYIFEKIFNTIGLFPDADGRRQFIFALLDRCNFERVCPKCSMRTFDILKHFLNDCPRTDLLRLLLKIKLKLYNAPVSADFTNKEQLFSLAINGKTVYLKIFSQFLANTRTI